MAGTPVKNAGFVSELLEALQLLTEVAVVKCKSHNKEMFPVTRGNNFADVAVR